VKLLMPEGGGRDMMGHLIACAGMTIGEPVAPDCDFCCAQDPNEGGLPLPKPEKIAASGCRASREC
jgi:hypothetical protein